MHSAIKIEKLSKQYRLGLVGTGSLIDDINRRWHLLRGKEDPYLTIGDVNDRSTLGSSNYVWALKDIDIEVEPGEVMGIIGKNGAGKSTLLKILSKVTAPTKGSISYKGRIGSLLEVGTGFNPELTGKENIYLNGAILGMRKKEIDRKFDEIVDFSGCDRYIDTPVKRYSSGMTVRLGFAVAAFLEPEILVVDEVLAVGDAEFQNKAIGKMKDVSSKEGRTVLFVSHNMASMKSLCKNGVLLHNGMVSAKGSIHEVIEQYLQGDMVFSDSRIIDFKQETSSEIKIDSVSINGSPLSTVELRFPNRELNIEVEGKALNSLKIAIELLIYDSNENLLGKFAPPLKSGVINRINDGTFRLTEKIQLPSNITNGEYYGYLDITHPNVEYLVRFPKCMKIITSGLIGATGISFDYKDTGFIIL